MSAPEPAGSEPLAAPDARCVRCGCAAAQGHYRTYGPRQRRRESLEQLCARCFKVRRHVDHARHLRRLVVRLPALDAELETYMHELASWRDRVIMNMGVPRRYLFK